MFLKSGIHLALAIVAAVSFWSPQQGAAASAQPLVDTAWLRQHLHDKTLVIIDVYDDNQHAAFASGHIPGALFTNFEKDGWRSQIGAVGMLPPIKDLEKLIGGFGIDSKSRVILVPGGRETADFNSAARIYWTFRALGDDNVSILDGGDKAWLALQSNPVATGENTAQVSKFVAHFRPAYLATRDDVQRAIRTADSQLVDARPPDQYQGQAKSPTVRVAGTLPNAVNVPSEQIVTSDGTRLADATAIDAVLVKAGAKTSGRQIVFCNTGHLAAGAWFLLHEVRNNKRASLYAGSMSDWTSDITLPVVNEPRS